MYEQVLEELFSKDCIFTLATVKDNKPSQRVVDTYYDGAFWIVTYGKSRKVKEIEENPHVSLCHNFQYFEGKAHNAGHPLEAKNKEIREKLTKAFAEWYFEHNNENDANMCYVKIDIEFGFFHKDGKGYKVDFINKKVEVFPFTPQIEMI